MRNIYQSGMSPEDLAQNVLNIYFDNHELVFPIDPFKMIRDLDIVYQFMEFKDLEGIYILPEDENDIPVIGINFNRPMTRQRFTAAHEICHFLKDKDVSYCPISGKKSDIERYADAFASELLMPIQYLKIEADKYAVDGKVNRYDILRIADYFGTSFESTVYAIAYKLNMLDGDTDSNIIKRENKKFKPDIKKAELGLDVDHLILWQQAVNSYVYFWNVEYKYAWYKFKNDFIYHENRLEKLNLPEDLVAEIITDLRLHKSDSKYCNEECKEIIQVAGHSDVYDYIYDTEDELDIYQLKHLNLMLYKYAAYPEYGGLYRQDNNFITGSDVETVEYTMIPTEIGKLEDPMNILVQQINNLSVSDVIKMAANIHHRITVIHPFSDGNGRSSRALLNWTYKLKGLPPIYIKYPEKEEYYEGLNLADKYNNYNKLYKVFMKETLRSSIQLNKIL